MELEKLFSEALGVVDPWKITSVKFDSAIKRLDIEVDFKRGTLFEYEDPTTGKKGSYTAYDTVRKSWRHLNFFEHECYLNVRVPRIKPQEGGIKMILPPWSGALYGFTLLFEALILQMSQHMPVHQVGSILNVADRKIWSVLDCYVQKALMLEDFQGIKDIGVDETSIKKGHNYISLFVDLLRKRSIFITEGKDHQTISKFAQTLETCGGKRENIRNVSCDMSPAFIKGVNQEFSQAKITFDKFHVLKIINEAVDAVRRAEAKQNPILKGTRYVFLKNNENLTTYQQLKKESLKKLNLKSIRALHIRENFQAIYQAESVEQFELLLKKWYAWAIRSKLPPMVEVAKTIKKHWNGIVQWKATKINNGILEGLNSVVQAAKRKARGYKFDHFRTMAFLLTGKLNFSRINPYLPTHFA